MANVQGSNRSRGRSQPRRPAGAGATATGLTLVKHLVTAGLGSRRACAALVLSGAVTVNGEVAESLMALVKGNDRIEVEGREVGRPARRDPV
ncbi:MAG: S4 domain-containing protein, partial [Dehalococcoidia bacterium]